MDPLKIVNQSGFPLQLGVAHAIDSSRTPQGWRVLYREHGWTHQRTGESGFIDLVVENDPETIVLNVECKRPQEATWQFLLPQPNDAPVRRCRYWATSLDEAGVNHFGWLDLDLSPDSYESAFCVVAGQDSKNRPMLERIASTVVASTEALAQEEARLLEQRGFGRLRTYVNIIVTTARLEVCRFDPATVDLQTGKVADGEFEPVPYIRFRKQLSPLPADLESQKMFRSGELATAKENTVLIVNATELVGLLGLIQLDPNIGYVLRRKR
jgi:hypothetical protein